MSNLSRSSSEKKLYKTKNEMKPSKQSPVKVETAKSTVKRSKITMNWNQFLIEQNTDITQTLKKNTKSQKQANSDKSIKVPDKDVQQTVSKVSYDIKNITYPDPNPDHISTYNTIAIDCEMVGIGDGGEHMLARVSLVDEYSRCLYDTFVKPMEPVVDYRTEISGVRPRDIENGKDFRTVQTEVYRLIHGKLLIGHAIKNDMKVLRLTHPRKYVRDTSKYRTFREMCNGATPSLKKLSLEILGLTIQEGEHSSVVDAYATMCLYQKYKDTWEKEFKQRHYYR